MENTGKREFISVCIALFLLIFGTYISGTLLVPYAISLGGTGITIGIIYSCMYAVRLVLGTPIGRLSQKKGAKTVLTYSMALYPLIAVAYWISWNIPSLLASRLLHGVASAMLLPMAMAYIGECSPVGSEGRYMSIYNTLFFTASAFGPITGGIIYEKFGIRPAFASLFGLAVMSLALILLIRTGRKDDLAKKVEAMQYEELPKFTMKRLLANRELMALGFMNVSMAVLLALFGASFTQFALSRRIGMGQIGAIIAGMNIIIGLGQIPAGKISDRYDNPKLILISGAAAALLAACFPFAGSLWSIGALMVLDSLFIALNIASTSALSTKIGREAGMSNTMGFLGTANSGGTILGYLALGFVSDIIGVGATFYFASAVFLLGLGAFILSVARVDTKYPRLYN